MLGFNVKFKIELMSIRCLLSAKNANNEIVLNGTIAGEKVRILLTSKDSPGLTNSFIEDKRFFFNKVEIVISNTTEELDGIVLNTGKAMAILMSYHDVVIEALNGIISYFKYELRNPMPRPITIADLVPQAHELYNPEWTTLEGVPFKVSEKPIEPGIISIPGIGLLQDNLFGIVPYSDDMKASLLERTFAPRDLPLLVDDLLSDAQAAALSGNFRRSVLELAITIEVHVKNSFFKREKIAGSAFEYLEDKGRENIKITELLDGAAAYAFGESFKKTNLNAYKDIDHIFRCRNKIAHRGEAIYRDDSGNWNQVDSETLRKWWVSTLEMFSWLRQKCEFVHSGN